MNMALSFRNATFASWRTPGPSSARPLRWNNTNQRQAGNAIKAPQMPLRMGNTDPENPTVTLEAGLEAHETLPREQGLLRRVCPAEVMD